MVVMVLMAPERVMLRAFVLGLFGAHVGMWMVHECANVGSTVQGTERDGLRVERQ